MFFQFRQNNSRGRFAGPAQYVIIEAANADEANSRAISDAGLYFNGCAEGFDCECCGDRWHEVWREDGDKVPSIYSVPLSEIANTETIDWDESPFCIVYYKDKQEVIERKPKPTIICAKCKQTEGAYRHGEPPTRVRDTSLYHTFEPTSAV